MEMNLRSQRGVLERGFLEVPWKESDLCRVRVAFIWNFDALARGRLLGVVISPR